MKRKRTGVIVTLLLLLLVYFILIASQDYKLAVTNHEPADSSPLTDEAQKDTLTEDHNWGPIGDQYHRQRQNEVDRLQPTFTNQIPPDIQVHQFFGDDLKRDEDGNKFVANPALMKQHVLPDGRVQVLPQNNGIRKYINFGDPEDFDCDEEFCYVNGRTVKKEIIKETPEDMFRFLPPEEEFLKEFRNPCWKGRDLLQKEKLFCVPFFYIIGFTKCGTTDLFAILKNHTLVSSRAGKETHYFDRSRRGRTVRMNRKPEKLPVSFMSWSNSGKFRQNLISTYQNTDSEQLFHGITMDATPSHVWDNEFWEIFHPGYREPPVTNPDVIRTISPNAKIIVSLRDPIKRMQSAYQFFCAYHVYKCDAPVTNVKFHRLVVESIALFNKCLESNTVRGCVYSTDAHQLAVGGGPWCTS